MTLHEMKLHEEINITDCISVQRVPSGWIYTTEFSYDRHHRISTVFVPLTSEFKDTEI